MRRYLTDDRISYAKVAGVWYAWDGKWGDHDICALGIGRTKRQAADNLRHREYREMRKRDAHDNNPTLWGGKSKKEYYKLMEWLKSLPRV